MESDADISRGGLAQPSSSGERHEADRDGEQAPRPRPSIAPPLGLGDDRGPTPLQRTPGWMRALRESWREAAEAKLARVPRDAEGTATSVVFDDVVVGTTAVTTVADFDDVLATEDQLSIQAVASQVTSGGASPLLTVAIEHSSDRRHWRRKNLVPEISDVPLSLTGTNVFFGSDAGSVPSLGFVRLSVKLRLLGTPSARITIHVRSRSK